MWKSRAPLWVTSSTAGSTSSPPTSSSTSVLFSRRTSRTCCCEWELFLGGICAWESSWIPFILFYLVVFICSFFPSRLLLPWFLFLTHSSVIHTMGKLVHLRVVLERSLSGVMCCLAVFSTLCTRSFCKPHDFFLCASFFWLLKWHWRNVWAFADQSNDRHS